MENKEITLSEKAEIEKRRCPACSSIDTAWVNDERTEKRCLKCGKEFEVK